MMTLASLFDGSGGFPLAGMLAGMEPKWASEIEPFPIRVTTKRLPEMEHLGDVTKIDGGKVEPVDVITFGSPCFPAGTLVLTDRGYIEIENIEVGDMVLTHEGRYRKVTATGRKEAETVVLKSNHYGLECTPNHPIYSLGEDAEWVPAEDMKGRLWAVPNAFEEVKIAEPKYGNGKQNKMPEVDGDLLYLVGRWLGDGWVRNGQRPGRPEGQTFGNIVICAGNAKEARLKAAVEKITKDYSVEREKSSVKYKFCGQVFCKWLTENFGKYAYGKRIPAWAYSMSENYREALFDGIMDSDGNVMKSGTLRITTVSEKLAHGVRLLGETLGYSTTVFFSKRPSKCVIEGREVNQRDTYTTEFTKSKTRPKKSDGKHSWYRVRSIEPTNEVKTVYNMTVEEDNSYVADGIVVHNCQDMSLAGRHAGLEGSRSGLFFEAIRIIKEMREATNGRYPKYAVWENVPGAFSSNGGEDFKAVLEAFARVAGAEVDMPRPERWEHAGYILGEGFSVAWRLLDAQFWGVPQRRKRIFLVADFGGECAPKILFESEGLSRYSKARFGAWKEFARDFEGGFGEAIVNLEYRPADSRVKIEDEDVAQTLSSQMGTGGGNVPLVMTGDEIPFHANTRDELINLKGVAGSLLATRSDRMQTYLAQLSESYSIQGNTINRKLENGANGKGVNEEVSFTLNTIDRYAVCTASGEEKELPPLAYGMSAELYQQGKFMPGIGEEVAPTMAARHEGLVEQQYAVRSLTPIECARLQGFPDRWCSDLGTENPSDEDMVFWRKVWDTWCDCNGMKRKTDSQIQRWLKDPYSEAAEYKMWGNGVALPCVWFVLAGIVWAEEQ